MLHLSMFSCPVVLVGRHLWPLHLAETMYGQTVENSYVAPHFDLGLCFLQRLSITYQWSIESVARMQRTVRCLTLIYH